MKKLILVGAIFFIGSIHAAKPENIKRGAGTSPAVESYSNDKTGQASYPTDSAPFPVLIIQSDEDKASASTKEKDAKYYSEADLQAYLIAAQAGKDQARASEWGIVIAGLGTVVAALALWFLVRTYCETRKAAASAHRSAVAAEEALEVTKISERPYVFLSSIEGEIYRQARLMAATFSIEHRDEGYRSAVTRMNLSNLGKSPALILRILAALEKVAELPESPDYSKCEMIEGHAVIGAGAVHGEFAHRYPESIVNATAIEKYFVYGLVEYSDIQGRLYVTGFGLEIFDEPMNIFRATKSKKYNYHT